MSKELIGIPCVGGKSRLVKTLSGVIEEQADKGNVTEVIDLCGGGGKIVLSLDRKKFKRLGYNEYEYGLATLMAMLKERDNINKIDNKVQFILDKVLTLGDAADKESIHRALFQVAKNYVVCGYNNHKDVDPITVAALTTIVIYGSVQSNRQTILYNAKDTKGNVFCRFEKRLKEVRSYINTFTDIHANIENVDCINADCFELIEKHKYNPNVLLVIDCPYYNSVNSYENDWSYVMHKRLVKSCKNAKCKIMICMNDKGIAPYWNLLNEPNWHFYKSEAIIHDSKKSDFDILKRNLMKLHGKKDKPKKSGIQMIADSFGEQYAKQFLQTFAFQNSEYYTKEVKDSQLSKVVQEYIVCNFEASGLEEYTGNASPYFVTEYTWRESNVSLVANEAKTIDSYYVLKEKADEQALLEKPKRVSNKNKGKSNPEFEEQIIELLGLPR